MAQIPLDKISVDTGTLNEWRWENEGSDGGHCWYEFDTKSFRRI